MADAKISQLISATALAGTEVVPVVQGGATKKATIDQILTPAAGKGIDFSANTGAAGMTSELLNDYEEGTWTPNVAFVGATSSEGTYTKIGRQVTIRGSLTGIGISVSPTGIVTDSLPFNTVGTVAGAISNVGNTQGGVVNVSGPFVVACSTISATTSIIFTATYFV
jgi:hypothetical protein